MDSGTVAPGTAGTVRQPIRQVAAVQYLVLGDPPCLEAHACASCGALYFDRRNACARCSGTEFGTRRLSNDGTVRAFTIVHRAAASVPVPYTSVIVDLEGGGVVQANLLGTADPERIRPGLRVSLDTFSAGTDDDGTEAIAFGYAMAGDGSE
jgi:uncharacterized OB-fold protein